MKIDYEELKQVNGGEENRDYECPMCSSKSMYIDHIDYKNARAYFKCRCCGRNLTFYIEDHRWGEGWE